MARGKAKQSKSNPNLYREAVRLIGQREVTLMKLRMDLPLWDEDKQYIEDTLKVMA